MKVGDIDTEKHVYLLLSLPDGCPAIVLHHPYSEKGIRPQIVATFANTEQGHELAEEICSLKNDAFPYLRELVEAQAKTATAVQNATIAILKETGSVEFEDCETKGGAK